MQVETKFLNRTNNLQRVINYSIFIFLITSLIKPCIYGQVSDQSMLNLERIFNSQEFNSERFGPARWLEDGSGYTTLERSENSPTGRDIVRYNPKTGEMEILISANKLIPEGEPEPLEISGYFWSPDGKYLLVFTNTKRVWRRNTRGDYWTLSLESGELKKLGGDAEPSTLMFAKFSPDVQNVAYVMKNNIYIENLATGSIKQVTDDGSKTLINGTFDWAYEEEFGLRDGFRWSPDSKSIAYWQLDSEGVRDFYLINNTDSLYPFVIPVQYPKVGETNSASRIGVVNINSEEILWMNVPGDPRNNYIARMEWAANSEELVIQHLNRHQNINEIMLCDINNGNTKTILTEKDETWLDVCDDLKWFNEGYIY